VLSDAGKVLLPMAQQLLLQAKHIEEAIWGLQGMVIGQLSMTCSTTVGKYLLPRLIAGFRTQYAEVQVSVDVAGRRDAMDSLLDGSADLAVVSSHLVHRDLEYQPFVEDQVVLVVPCDHPWADGRTVKPENLLEYEHILREPTAGSYEVLSNGLADHGLNIADLRVAMTLGNAEAVEMSVEAGLGVAFVSRFVASRGVMLGRIAEVPVEGMALTRLIYMVRHVRRAATAPQQAFWDFAFDPAHEEMRLLPDLNSGPGTAR
jgi:DNA-binding transcriptional LysR family regulator